MTAMPLLAVALLAQSPATPAPMPTTPEGCLVAAREFTRTEQRALKQVTADTVRRIEAEERDLVVRVAARDAAFRRAAREPLRERREPWDLLGVELLE